MKNIYFIITIILFLLMLLLPVMALGAGTPNQGTSESEKKEGENIEQSLVLFDTASKQTLNLSFEDYLVGVLAAEVPVSYHDEAIKAQTVASYTYALYCKEQNKNEEYDITTDSTLNQGYLSIEKAREKWGDNADEYEKRLREIINSVKGEFLSYNGDPILAAFHAISSGKTENCENVWEKSLPYLVSVDSMGDLLCEGYTTSVSFTVDQFKSALESLCEFSGEASLFITNFERHPTGSVKTVIVCGKDVSGTDFRKALNLRSTNFDVALLGDVFTITTRGYGHGVGMSQNGAQYMAAQGNTYKEILAWYYTDCSLSKNDL